ncbi:MAG TPA: nucleoside triphosphate pyrophosphohydrolase, partial [Deltaproteobacteria bacterium]|nr:nucleoside triphosphate pyrophosphohydrolase [Deltaproteobacteria bacterium]
IQSVVSRVGFDWPDPAGVIDKIREEADELLQAMKSGDHEQVEEEIGDLLFSIVNLARFNKTDPEAALRKTNSKFVRRFHEIEKHARDRGITLEDMTLEEMDNIWDEAKKKE